MPDKCNLASLVMLVGVLLLHGPARADDGPATTRPDSVSARMAERLNQPVAPDEEFRKRLDALMAQIAALRPPTTQGDADILGPTDPRLDQLREGMARDLEAFRRMYEESLRGPTTRPDADLLTILTVPAEKRLTPEEIEAEVRRRIEDLNRKLGRGDRETERLARDVERSGLPTTAPDSMSTARSLAPPDGRSGDLAAVLAGLERDFGPGPWTVVNRPIEPDTLAAVFMTADHPERGRTVAEITRAQSLVATGTTPNQLAAVALFVMKDQAAAGRMMDLLAEVIRDGLRAGGRGSVVRVRDIRIEVLEGHHADRAGRVSLTIESADTQVRQRLLYLSRGDVVLEILDSNVGLSDRQWLDLADNLLTRHAAARAAPPPEQPAER